MQHFPQTCNVFPSIPDSTTLDTLDPESRTPLELSDPFDPESRTPETPKSNRTTVPTRSRFAESPIPSLIPLCPCIDIIFILSARISVRHDDRDFEEATEEVAAFAPVMPPAPAPAPTISPCAGECLYVLSKRAGADMEVLWIILHDVLLHLHAIAPVSAVAPVSARRAVFAAAFRSA